MLARSPSGQGWQTLKQHRTAHLGCPTVSDNTFGRPLRHGRQGKPRKDGKPTASRSDGLRAAMTARLASDDGKACYAKRQQTIEPVFGQIKEVRGARRFLRRGLAACDAEWKLMCGTHNLLKLWRHQTRPPLASPATT
jgi:Transposase DDE domain